MSCNADRICDTVCSEFMGLAISSANALHSVERIKWVAQGALVALPGASLKHMRYTRPELLALSPETVLLSLGLDNKNQSP